MGIYDTFSFGKYKHHRLVDVINSDLDYIIWALRNVEHFILDDEAYHRFDTRVKVEYRQDNLLE